MKIRNLQHRTLTDKMLKGITGLLCILVLLPFLILVLNLIARGWKAFTPDLFIQEAPSSLEIMLAEMDEVKIGGGILNSIYGTCLTMGIAFLLALPLGLLTGICIHEYRFRKWISVLEYSCSMLSGIPSLLVGIVVYLWLVKPLHHFSALAGGIALAIILLPYIARFTYKALANLPANLRESGIMLGGSSASILLKIELPAIRKQWMAEMLIVSSNVLGQTSPLLVTSMGMGYINWNVQEPVCTLPVLIWHFFNNPELANLMWSAALVLFLIILILNIIANYIYPKKN